MKAIKIIPSLLVNNLKEFKNRLQSIEDIVKIVQIDVIDGLFADNKTITSPSQIIKIKTPVKWEVQLMVNNLDYYITSWLRLKPYRIIIPYEVVGQNIDKYIKIIKKHKIQVGIQIEPETKPEVLSAVINKIDLVLLMTVHSGWSGQKFIPKVLSKVKILKKLNPKIKVSVDGGINQKSIIKCKQAGVDYFSVNSAIFKNKEPQQALKQLEQSVK